MRALRFLVRCELKRGPSLDGEGVLHMLNAAIEEDEAEDEPSFVRPEEKPPVVEGRVEEEEEVDADAD